MNASNYADALAKSFLFYEAQRSGQLPVDNRVLWRRSSALGDATARYDANNNGLLEANETLSRDLSGGYYDAGDRMKYAFPMANAMTMLTWGLTQYQNGYSQSGQLGFALASIKWGTDWLLKAHETTGIGATLQTLRFWGQVGRTNTDHNTWSDDQNIAMPRPAYFIDATKPGSDLAGEVAAAFASASIIFRSTNPTYASLLLDHAKAMFKFAYQYQGLYSNSITDSAAAYSSNNFNDELAWGAIWLHRAIKANNGNVNDPLSWANNQTYLQIAKSKNIGLGTWTQTWGNKEYGTAILIAQEDSTYSRTAIENWLNYWTVKGPGSIPYTSGGLAFLDGWGSLRYAANTAFLAAIYSDTLQDYNGRYANFAKGQIDYILGNNPRGSSYVVGFGGAYTQNPHHAHAHLNGRPDYTGSNGWDLFNANTPSYNLLTGALVGGPGSLNDFDYQDTIQDYFRNEVALDYNAGFSGALAYLYSQSLGNLPVITLAISPSSVQEDGLVNLVYTFTRSGITTNALTANYTVGGTATLGTDYTGIATMGTPKTVTFAANSPTATVIVDPTADTTGEANETVALTLATGTGYTVGTTMAVTGTILNDDLPTITLTANDPNAGETNNPGSLTLTRTGPTSSPLQVTLALGGSATKGSDYNTISATATFAVGSSTVVIPLTPVDDLVVEGDETAILTLLSGSGYILGSATSATVTLVDNDRNGTNAGNTLTGDGGNNALNGLGGNDGLNGGAGSDRLNGGVGKDILTGGIGMDQFVLGALGDSLLGGFDVITDYTLGEQIDVPVAIATSTLTASSGNATSLTATAIQAVLTNGVFTANSARTFTVTGQTGTFLALNDGISGFNASTDSLIHLSNYTISTPNPVTLV
jgi:endoglucanase